MKTNTDNKTEKRSNRFSGESIMLTKEEAIIHDRIFINELTATLEDKELGYGEKHFQHRKYDAKNFLKNFK